MANKRRLNKHKQFYADLQAEYKKKCGKVTTRQMTVEERDYYMVENYTPGVRAKRVKALGYARKKNAAERKKAAKEKRKTICRDNPFWTLD